MANNQKIYSVVGAVVIAGLSFFGGMQYAGSQPPAGLEAGMPNRQFMRQTPGAGAAFAGGGATVGEILSKDATSMTVKLTDGGSKIVFYSSSTRVTKTSDGSLSDVAIGTQVFITGTSNTDGSVTAQSIQLRPIQPQSR